MINRNWNTALLFVLISTCGLNLRADVSMRRRAVDVFLLKNGTRLLGVMLDPTAQDSVRLLMRTEWLKKNAPEIYTAANESHAKQLEQPKSTDVATLLRAHIETLRKADPPHLEKIGYLEERLTGLEDARVPDSEPSLVVLSLPRSAVRSQLLKRPDARQAAGLAILNNIAISETADAATLNRELLQQDAQQLVRSLPSAAGPNGQQAIRQFRQILLQADRLLGKTSKLVLQNGLYISESAAAQNPELLATQLLSGQVSSQLQQLLGDEFAARPRANAQSGRAPEQLPPKASSIAEREQADVVELTSMNLNAVAGTASVSIAVYHRIDDGGKRWSRAAAVTGSAGSQDVTDERQREIADDPRVKQITQLFNGLGAGQNQLAKAISIGAVVEVAQQRARAELAKTMENTIAAASVTPNLMDIRLTELPPAE